MDDSGWKESNTKSTPNQSGSSNHAPSSISGALRNGDIKVLVAFLDDRFEQASRGDYAWIRELRDVGYTNLELAQLLHQRAHDSPWIYFEPTCKRSGKIQSYHHIQGCVHHMSGPQSHKTLPLLNPNQETARAVEQPLLNLDQESIRAIKQPLITPSQETTRAIEELCGIGGISPSSRDANHWKGTVNFEDCNSKASVSYGTPNISSDTLFDLLVQLALLAGSFSSVVGITQADDLCCNSFTILHTPSSMPDLTNPELHLSRIMFRPVEEFLSLLRMVLRPPLRWRQNLLIPREFFEDLHQKSQVVIGPVIG